ncbi:MAG: hypothetical protein ACRYFZ_15075 [Janthinobacterium lividum]
MPIGRLLDFAIKTRRKWRPVGGLLVLAGGLLGAPACSPPAKQRALPASFRYQGDFYPAFLPAATFSIQTRQGTGQLKLRRYVSRSSRQQLADSVALTGSDLSFFFAALDSVPVLKMATKEQYGLDGIDVENSVSYNGQHNSFRFWSPKKHSPEHKLVEAVLGLARRKFPRLPQKAYFESLEEYFHFGLPCEITSTNPWEVRLHGVIYGDESYLRELQIFLELLPTNQPVLIDMSNSHGMAHDCFPLFGAFLARNKRVIWVASRAAKADVLQIGVPTDHIVSSITQGRQLVQAL